MRVIQAFYELLFYVLLCKWCLVCLRRLVHLKKISICFSCLYFCFETTVMHQILFVSGIFFESVN